MKNKPLVIIGAGGHAKTVLDTAICADTKIAGFLSARKCAGEQMNDVKILGGDELLDDPHFINRHRFIIGVGDQDIRRTLHTVLVTHKASLATVVHPSCIVSSFSNIGDGSLLAAGSIVNSNVQIGQSCILNTASSIDHDCHIGDLCQISPGARLGGGVNCGSGVFIGIGAAVLPSINIGENAFVGGGAVVIQAVDSDTTVVGVPAKLIKFG